MQKWSLTCLILFTGFFIVACNKKEQSNPVDRGTTLTTHQWKIKTLYYRMKSDATNLNFTSVVYQPCELDDVYVFATDSTFSRGDGAISCTIMDFFGPWGSGTWSANGDVSQFAIKNIYYSITFTVDELTNTSMILEQETRDTFGNDVVYTYDFVSG